MLGKHRNARTPATSIDFEDHRHRTAVVLPDGTTVTAVSFDPGDPYGREQRPDYGLYLDSRWQPPWPHDHVGWPDFGVPEEQTAIMTALRSLLARARTGQRVEVGCLAVTAGPERPLHVSLS